MAEDTSCRQFRFCYEGVLITEIFTCGEGAHFDRANGTEFLNYKNVFTNVILFIGACVPESMARCPYSSVAPPLCTPGLTALVAVPSI